MLQYYFSKMDSNMNNMKSMLFIRNLKKLNNFIVDPMIFNLIYLLWKENGENKSRLQASDA